MHEQETFDAMVWHLRRQNQKSMDQYGQCRYRGPSGLMCAVGFLIPDSDYCGKMEHKSALAWPVNDTLRQYRHNLDLCRRMQLIHDKIDLSEWERGFKDVAQEFNLKYTPPPVEI